LFAALRADRLHDRNSCATIFIYPDQKKASYLANKYSPCSAAQHFLGHAGDIQAGDRRILPILPTVVGVVSEEREN
jgi:hypothetical protein